MTPHTSANLTQVLTLASSGDASAAARLFPLVYEELREFARGYFQRQSAAHTLQPTALVHEAYAKLIDSAQCQYNDRNHFMAVAAKAMRQILTDHARAKQTLKRGSGEEPARLTFHDSEQPSADERDGIDVLALDRAMAKLNQHDERKATIVELRVFGGLTCEQVALLLNMPMKTAEAHWYAARAFLRRELERGA